MARIRSVTRIPRAFRDRLYISKGHYRAKIVSEGANPCVATRLADMISMSSSQEGLLFDERRRGEPDESLQSAGFAVNLRSQTSRRKSRMHRLPTKWGIRSLRTAGIFATMALAMLAMLSPATAASAKPESAIIASTMVKTNSISAFGIMGKPDKTTVITPLAESEGARGLKDSQTNRCLDSNIAGQVYANPCQFPKNLYQNWELWQYDLMTPGGVSYSVWAWKDVATGRCLDSNAAGNLYTNSCQAPGNTYQTWVGGVISNEIVDEQTGLCLDGNSAGQAYTHACNGGGYQLWIQL